MIQFKDKGPDLSIILMIKTSTNEFRFCFKPMNKSQHELVLGWIHQPHINEWLHGEGLSNTITDIDQFLNNGEPWATMRYGYIADRIF